MAGTIHGPDGNDPYGVKHGKDALDAQRNIGETLNAMREEISGIKKTSEDANRIAEIASLESKCLKKWTIAIGLLSVFATLLGAIGALLALRK